MDDQPKPKKRAIRQDRVTLKADALEKLIRWSQQLNERVKGIKITRSDIVDWIVQSHSDSLSDNELGELEKLHFDDIKYAQWALTELKKARQRGETVPLSTLFSKDRS